jgi:hypothetical protein
MKLWAGLLALSLLCACQPPLAAAAGQLSPSPAVVSAVVLQADDARRAAFASADPKPLETCFGGRSLLNLRLQIGSLALRGLRRVEILEARRLVHQGGLPGQPEVVLEIRAHEQTGAGWSTVLRQWRAQLGRQGDRWLVLDDGDLAPVAWWSKS